MHTCFRPDGVVICNNDIDEEEYFDYNEEPEAECVNDPRVKIMVRNGPPNMSRAGRNV
jgi:hypothetical protein